MNGQTENAGWIGPQDALGELQRRTAMLDAVGYAATRSRTATRTDTPLLDTPQSMSVVTQDLIKDQNMQSMADVIRYVPGMNLHQGESNRDQVVIRVANLEGVQVRVLPESAAAVLDATLTARVLN